MPLRHIFYIVGINFIWGLTPLVLKYGMSEMPALLLMGLRFLFGSLVLLAMTRWHRGQMTRVLAIAFIAGPLAYSALAAGLALVHNMATVGIANQLNVPFAALMSVIVLGEDVHWRRWLGIGMAFAGGMVVAFDPVILADLPGFVIVTLSAFLNAISILIARGVKDVHPLQMQGWLAHLSWPVLLGSSLIFDHAPLMALSQASPMAWFAIVFGALATSMIAHAGFFWMVQRYEVSHIAPFMLLSPLFTILFGVLLMGNALTTRIIIGGLMTMAGVTIINLRDRRVVAEQVTHDV